MKWFTRAWHQGDLTDDEIDAAEADYERHIRSLRPALPPGLQVLGEGGGNVSLHDGRFINLERKQDTNDTFLLDIATRDMQRGSLVDNVWNYPLLHVRLAYYGAQLLSPSWDALQELTREPTTEILYGEVDRHSGGSLDHRMLLWPRDAPHLAVRFASVDVAVVRFVDGCAEVAYQHDLD